MTIPSPKLVKVRFFDQMRRDPYDAGFGIHHGAGPVKYFPGGIIFDKDTGSLQNLQGG